MLSMAHPKALTLLLLFLVILPFCQSQSTAQCFYPDGLTLASGDIPCNSSATQSSCCGPDSWCLDNGLCMQYGQVSRGSCTDRTWGTACAQYCSDGELLPLPLYAFPLYLLASGKNKVGKVQGRLTARKVNPSGGTPMTNCDPSAKTWYCDYPDHNSTACSDPNSTFVLDGGSGIVLRGFQVFSNSSSSSSSSSSGSGVATVIDPSSTLPNEATTNSSIPVETVTASATAAANCTSPLQKQSGRYTAAQLAGVGVGIGIPLLLALVCAGVIIVGLRRRLGDQRAGNGDGNMVKGMDTGVYPHYAATGTTGLDGGMQQQQHHVSGGEYGGYDQSLGELDSREAPKELGTAREK